MADFEVGMKVKFLGYGDDVKEEDRVLEEGEVYEVELLDEEDADMIAVRIDNPAFDPKKKASKNNPETILVDVFAEEVEIVEDEKPKAKGKAKAAPAKAAPAKGKAKAEEPEEDEEEDEEDAEEEEEEEEEEKPAPKAKAKAKAAPAKAETKAPAKAKGKTETKGKAPVKSKTKAAAKEEKEEVDEDALPDLENEDEEVAQLVSDSEDVLALAEELVEEENSVSYRLGGVLYHIRKGKLHHKADKRYKEKGGFGLYVKEHLAVEYRKAMDLITIYVQFNQAGISGEKVAELGWAKCAKIASVMAQQSKGGASEDEIATIAEELVEAAASGTVAELNETIKESYKVVGATAGERKKMIIFKFKLFEDQAEGVTNVLNAAAAALGHKKLDQTFEHIIMEWAAEHPLEEAKSETETKASRRTAEKASGKTSAGKKPVRTSARA